MARKAFKMYLIPGNNEEYYRRHNKISQELIQLLRDYCISNYSIYFDEETNVLFAIYDVDDESKLEDLKNNKIMKQWWEFMSDIMETNKDKSPKITELQKMFFLE